jgi:hypothetical protein
VVKVERSRGALLKSAVAPSPHPPRNRGRKPPIATDGGFLFCDGRTTGRFPPPWRAENMPGGYIVRDANGQALAFV